MKKIFKKVIISVILLSTLIFCSCDGYAKVELNKDNSVFFGFSGNIGNAFKEMMGAVGESTTIDVEGVTTALINSGFVDVKVAAENENIMISFVDPTRESYLFKSGIVSVVKDDVKISITPEKFLQMYNSSGEDIQMLLDLFLSPVLCEEEMSEADYVDTISVTYGEAAGKEIGESKVHFTILNKNGKKKVKDLFVKSILCGINTTF